MLYPFFEPSVHSEMENGLLSGIVLMTPLFKNSLLEIRGVFKANGLMHSSLMAGEQGSLMRTTDGLLMKELFTMMDTMLIMRRCLRE
jgi:hypothetical protein